MNNNTTRRITRRKGACLNCKQRKTRCDGSPTCSQCMKSDLVCSYNTARPVSRNGKTRDNPNGRTYPDALQQWTGERRSTSGSEFSLDSSGELADSIMDLNVPSFNAASMDVAPELAFRSFDIDRSCEFSSEVLTQYGVNMPLSGDDDHPLDHSISFGSDHEWSRVWADDLCGDFSSMSPLGFLSKHLKEEVLRVQVSKVSKKLAAKIRRQPRTDARRSSLFDEPDNLSFYADQKTVQYIDAFFNECYGCPMYVNRQCIEDRLADMMFSPDAISPWASVLVNGVLAIGCRAISRRDNPTHIIPTIQASQYFERALRRRQDLIIGPPSLPKVQALVTLVLYTNGHRNIDLTRSLLSQAVQQFQGLTSSLPKTSLNLEEKKRQEQIETIFWLLYSIEKPFMMRFGGYSMIDDDLIAYPPPSKRDRLATSTNAEAAGWEIVNYRYARLCSVIVKTIYSQGALRMSRTETVASIRRLSQMLEAWRMSIPSGYRPDSTPGVLGCSGRCWDNSIQIDLYLRYAEAAFAIHRWSIIEAGSIVAPSDSAAYMNSCKTCVDLAKGVIALTHSFTADDPELEWSRTYMPLLSTIIVFMAISKLEAGKNSLPYLGIASGYFGRMATGSLAANDLFEDIMHLSSIAHRLLNSDDLNDPYCQTIDQLTHDKTQQARLLKIAMQESPTPSIRQFEFPNMNTPESLFDFGMQEFPFDHHGIA